MSAMKSRVGELVAYASAKVPAGIKRRATLRNFKAAFTWAACTVYALNAWYICKSMKTAPATLTTTSAKSLIAVENWLIDTLLAPVAAVLVFLLFMQVFRLDFSRRKPELVDSDSNPS